MSWNHGCTPICPRDVAIPAATAEATAFCILRLSGDRKSAPFGENSTAMAGVMMLLSGRNEALSRATWSCFFCNSPTTALARILLRGKAPDCAIDHGMNGPALGTAAGRVEQ